MFSHLTSVVCQGNHFPVWTSWADLTILWHELLENSTRWGASGQNCVIQPSACTLCSAKRPWRVPLQKIPPFMSREWLLWWTSGKINLTANLCHLLMYFTKGDWSSSWKNLVGEATIFRHKWTLEQSLDFLTLVINDYWVGGKSCLPVLKKILTFFGYKKTEELSILLNEPPWGSCYMYVNASLLPRKKCCIQKKGGSKQKCAIWQMRAATISKRELLRFTSIY